MKRIKKGHYQPHYYPLCKPAAAYSSLEQLHQHMKAAHQARLFPNMMQPPGEMKN